MSTAKRVIKNTGFLYARMGITIFISLYNTRLVLNALGASDFGIFSIVGGAIAMLGFLNASMASATQRFMSFAQGEGDKLKQKKIFNISAILHFFIALLLGVVLLIAGYFFFNGILNINKERLYAAKVVYGSLIVSTMFTVTTVPYDAVLNAHENMKYYAIVGIFESLLKLAVALAVVYLAGDKLVIYGVLMAIIPLITMSITRVYCLKHYPECKIIPSKYWDKSMMKEMTRFAGWSFFGTMTSMVTQYGQGIILNMFFGTIVNAAQGVANQIAGQLNVFSNNMLKALNPVIIKREGEGDREKMLQATFIGSKLSYFLLAIFTIPIMLEMPYILKLWLTNVPEYAIIFTRLILINSLITQLFLTITVSISATGNIKELQLANSVISIFPLIIAYFLFRMGYSPTVLYIALIILTLVRYFGPVLFYAKKYAGLRIRFFFRSVVLPAVIITVISFCTAYIPHCILQVGILRAIVVSLLFIPVFSILVVLVGLTKQERVQIVNVFKK